MWSPGDKIKKDEIADVCRIYGRWTTCNMNDNRLFTQATQHCISWKRRKTKKEWQRTENTNVSYIALYLRVTVADYIMKTKYDCRN